MRVRASRALSLTGAAFTVAGGLADAVGFLSAGAAAAFLIAITGLPAPAFGATLGTAGAFDFTDATFALDFDTTFTPFATVAAGLPLVFEVERPAAALAACTLAGAFLFWGIDCYLTL